MRLPRASDEDVADATGRTWLEWFRLLDKARAHEWPTHNERASWLEREKKLDARWAQAVAVEYERERGLRAVGQRTEGHYEASIQRAMDAPRGVVLRALDAPEDWTEDDEVLSVLREPPRSSATKQGTVLRYASAHARVEVAVGGREDGRSVVRVTEGALASADAREASKKRWADALDSLKAHLASNE